MNGIVVEEYQSVYNQDSINFDNLNRMINNLIFSFSEIRDLAGSNESTNFIKNQINQTIDQLNNVRDNFREYNQILSSVYTGYKQQSEQISNSIKSVIPNN